MNSSRSRLAAVLAGAMALALVIGAPAEARRGGSFGSRGARTYSTPSQTSISPGYVGPVQRSMTAPPAGGYSGGYAPGRTANAPSPYNYGGGYQQPRYNGFPRMGFGGGLLAGLATGGLLGAMMGHGFGGGWGGMGGGMGLGFISTLFQLGVLALLIWLAVRFFRRRNAPALAGGYASAYDPGPAPGYPPQPGSAGPWGAAPGGYAPATAQSEVSIGRADEQAFERLLIEVQDAFGREDYGALRERTTPEIMSYLSEELSQNATHGRRNEVTRTRLLRSEVSEAWREGDDDFATVALNYESADVMRDRQSGQVLKGDPDVPTVTTELWTFVRRNGGPWKLSAIQETET
jgi:predicted lipid-binding transport protein (Tim44 family)